EAFWGPERRRATRPATVPLHGNPSRAARARAARYVERAFAPFALPRIDVRPDRQPAGTATPFTIGRHAHPKARPEHTCPGHAEPTGIDYLRILDTTRGQQLQDQINYAALMDAPAAGQIPGQPPLTQPPSTRTGQDHR